MKLSGTVSGTYMMVKFYIWPWFWHIIFVHLAIPFLSILPFLCNITNICSCNEKKSSIFLPLR